MQWRFKNRPAPNKRIITKKEVEEQVGWAFKKDYSGYGCDEPIISSFCDPECPVRNSPHYYKKKSGYLA